MKWWCLVWALVGSLGAKNLSYMSSSYQGGMVVLKQGHDQALTRRVHFLGL